MKVTLLNTWLKGGAGIACNRLHQALQKSGVESRILTQGKSLSDPSVSGLSDSLAGKIKSRIRLTADMLHFIGHERSWEDRFQFSPGMKGTDISNHPFIKDSDIIHLHWINQGFLSYKSIQKLSATGKPLVSTLHDMWAFTGGCHYSGDCLGFMTKCNYCPYLRDSSSYDLSTSIWERKKELYDKSKIVFVTCSEWLKQLALQSGLLREQQIITIGNPINTNKFRPEDKKASRRKWNLPLDKKLILFGAMNISDKRKGFDYLIKGLNELSKQQLETKGGIELVTFGKLPDQPLQLPYPIHHLGSLSSDNDIIRAYSACDVFVLPSIQDNLPNTVMESMACGTPVVAFETGGIPEMIDSLKNGYLASYKSSYSLAEGISFLLHNDLSIPARKKIQDNFSEEIIVQKYISLYKDLERK